MAFTATKILLIALFIATWANSLPTIAGAVSSCDRESDTNTTSTCLDCSGLSSDAIANSNANTNDSTEPSIMEICFPDESCCRTAENCPQVGRCFDEGRCSGPTGCDVPGRSASTTSSFTCAPMQTCATSLIAPGASAEVFTFACFDTRTRIAEIVAPGVARVTPMPMLDPVPVLEYPNPAPESTSNTESTWLETDTLTVIGFGDYPYGSTTVETLIWTSTKDAPFATDMPLSLSSETTLTVIPILQGTTTPASMTSIQTNAQASIQAIPTVVSSKSTPGSPGPSHTSIVIGGLFGSLAFVGIFITSVDYLIKRRRYNRCRDSISDTSTGDDTSAPSKEEQHQQMTAYGYYGTNRAGIVTKGSGVFKANAEPVELPAENATEHRE